ncbi:MAG: hypothetical protein KKD28_07205 [Chloroflexi bacterium]|nr:hypothetical protein [Chloroflexota bacterium]
MPTPTIDLRLRLLGRCEITHREGELRLESNKTRALLVYLVMNPHPHQRDTLIGLFWGEFPESKARRNLRHALWNLRKQVNLSDYVPILLSDTQAVSVNPQADIWLDVAVFQEEVTRLTSKQEIQDIQDSRELSALATATELHRGGATRLTETTEHSVGAGQRRLSSCGLGHPPGPYGKQFC